MTDIQRRWDLWHLKTLFPDWGEAELSQLMQEGATYDAAQQRLFGRPQAAAKRFAPRAAQVLADHPDLTTGLTISLHLGPYSLAPVPWLVAGHDVHVLVNRTSLAEIQPVYDSLQAELKLPGQVVWVPIEGHGFALRLLRALRRQLPVFAFLDGNDGLAGCEGTLRQGIIHRLPGRDIRVRTGLARLALSLRCPVHSLVTVWDQQGQFSWVRGPTWTWQRGTSQSRATSELFRWAFGVIRRHPAQWRAWNMLTGVCDSFRPEASPPAGEFTDPWQVLAAANTGLSLRWQRPATIWPGDMLEDVAGSCFYTAAGLQAADLAWLQEQAAFSPAEVRQRFGDGWIRAHLPRLVALGFVGRAGGPESLLIPSA